MVIASGEKKICLLYTGGTIGMQRIGGALRPPENAYDFLHVAPELSTDTFEFVPLMNKDSTNMNCRDWTEIASAIYSRKDHFRGFVVAHGTDTMHFTASAVAFALGPNLNFPVVFTGSQAIPQIEHGDARVNLIRAFKVADTDLAEVAIVFGDFVFRGCRTQKKDERKFDAFESPSFFPIGLVTEEIVLNPSARLRKTKSGEIDFRPHFSDGIVQLSLIPGLEPYFIERLINSEQCKGLILQSFGAGNVPDGGDYSVVDVIRQATEAGIPTIVTSQFPAHSTLYTQYETGLAAVKAGAIGTGNMTGSCATAKFRWVLANVDRESTRLSLTDRLKRIREDMLNVVVDEMDT